MKKNDFKIKFLQPKEHELEKIGFDSAYIKKGIEKHKFKSLKIHGLNCAQANIIKQTALSCGTDCAVHKNTICAKIEKSDCILSGSLSELQNICEKLKKQPFCLNSLGTQIQALLNSKTAPLKIREKTFNWGERPYIMGILNVTPDSFSDGGKFFELSKAYEHALELIAEGADILDIGGESTRPYSKKISPEEEIQRILPVITKIRENNPEIPLSIDTRNAKTAAAAIDAGADIINDVSALDWDKDMLKAVKDTNAALILNHSKGTPDIMQENTNYTDVVDEIYDYFEKKIVKLNDLNISKIIIDPGLGFGKNVEQNFEIIKRMEEFKTLGCPILAGHSRKTFLQETFETKDVELLDELTNLVSYELIKNGAQILRVHNVKILKRLIKLNEML